MTESKFYSKDSKYAARIKSSNEIIYTSIIHNRENEDHCWFSHDEPRRDCNAVMNNKQFNRMLANGEVELLTSILQP